MKRIIALAVLAFGCGAPAEDEQSLEPQELGSLEQPSIPSGNYRPSRLLGITPSTNQKCTPSQSASTECYYVQPDPGTDFRKSYKVYLNKASFGVGTGAEMETALQTAANLFNNTSFQINNAPAAAIVISNTNVGAQCIIERIDLPFSTSTNLINHMLVQHDSTTLIPANNCTTTPCVDMPGTWKRGTVGRIRIEGDNLASIPGVPFAKAELQTVMAGLMGCIGLGRQSTVNTSWTFNFVQPTVYNLTDAWGTNNCEDRYVAKHQVPNGNAPETRIDFYATTGACS
jgi:hypothetical protein